MKGYFDGGNKPDSTQYEIVTLGAFIGTNPQWRRFDQEWKSVVHKKHGALYAHAADATSLNGAFRDWSESEVDAMYDDCVAVIEKHAAVQHTKLGLLPMTVSVLNQDFVKAYQQIPELGAAPQHCSTQCCEYCFQFGEKFYPGNSYQFYFDQNEPYRGHVADRRDNPKIRRQEPIWNRVVTLAESDMKVTPGLQAADALAWAVNRDYIDGLSVREWQSRLLRIYREQQILGYDRLMNPDPRAVATFMGWKLPKRRAPR